MGGTSGIVYPIAAILLTTGLLAAAGPQPPCGHAPDPPYPSLDEPPAVQVWEPAEVSPDWSPASCTGWSTSAFSTLTAAAARFRYTGGIDGLRRRIGAISAMKGMLYWSTTDRRCQPLILEAHA